MNNHSGDAVPSLNSSILTAREDCRQAVLTALDTYAQTVTGFPERGWKDSELLTLFPVLDKISDRIYGEERAQSSMEEFCDILNGDQKGLL